MRRRQRRRTPEALVGLEIHQAEGELANLVSLELLGPADAQKKESEGAKGDQKKD